MKRKKFIICLATFSALLPAPALPSRDIQYSPLLDPAVTIYKAPARAAAGEYIWHPGQLSAHLQQKRRAESAARCVNVGYPGKFYAPSSKTLFRKEMILPSETIAEWTSTGAAKVFLDGAPVADTPAPGAGNPIKLPKGKSILLFEIESAAGLPALKITIGNQPSADGWQSSLDGAGWNFAETSPVFGAADKTPLADPEMTALINPASIAPLRNAVVENGKIIIRKNGYVLVDFFHLEVGRVSFTAKGKGSITAFVGESPEEALNENPKNFEQRPIEQYTLSDIEKQITLPERAVRYIKITCDGECEITMPALAARLWPVDFQMSFECDDARMNNIWRASVASLHTGMHGFYLDGIKRDYLPWSMDAVVSALGGDYVFSDKQVSLNGLSVAMLPLNPEKADLGIPDYPLHALVGFSHHYKRYGDFNTILSYRDRIEQLLRLYETLQDERGFVSAAAGGTWGFVPGWSTRQGPDQFGAPAYAQIMLYYNYIIGAGFCEKWGDKKSAQHWQSKAETLRESIFKCFWDETRGLFLNGYTQKGNLDTRISHHAQFWAVLAGIFPENRYAGLFAALPEIPGYRDDVSYEKGYEFLAYAKARRVREMWEFLFAVFGDWLDQGHSRVPENFSYKKTSDGQLAFYKRPFGLSLCHGANGVPGIVAVLHGLAGFGQSDTQPNHYTIQPDLMDLQWADIGFPVKEGKITLKLSRDGAGVLEIPAGCHVDYINKNGEKKSFAKKGTHRL
ncbi:MAG: hypothetical protein LBM04_02075 [Opitutaceae bacterium]|jgi:hypothetical protein|nr:hypothetical protein [Opitutaceae bacterium]